MVKAARPSAARWRVRPLWDFVTLLLLAGATVVTFSGAWLSWRVLHR